MNNYNNYPSKIIDFCNNVSLNAWENFKNETENNISVEILSQSVYDILSPIVFENFVKGNDINYLEDIFKNDEEINLFISQLKAQTELLNLKEKGLLKTDDHGKTFDLTELGKKILWSK